MTDLPSMSQYDWLSQFLKMLTITGQLEVRCSYGTPWDITWAKASAYEIPYHIVLSGRAIIEDDESGTTQELKAGDIVLFPHATAHKLHCGSGAVPGNKRIRKATGGWTPSENDSQGERLDMLCGRFCVEAPHDRLIRNYLPTRLVVHSVVEPSDTRIETGNRLFNLIELMRVESNDDKPGASAALNSLSSVLFTLALRAASKSKAPPAGLLALASQPRLAPAISAMFEHPARAWNIPDLAELCNMSRATFMRTFKEKVGHSAGELLQDIRMNLAANELKKSSMTVEAVSELVGYQSVSGFRKVFAQRMGVTAGRWRRLALKNG